MPLYLKKGNITRVHCDAIVNATDIFLSGSGGVDKMIHKAIGFDLSLECIKSTIVTYGRLFPLAKIHKYTRPEDVPEKTPFIITTNGYENASCRYSSK